MMRTIRLALGVATLLLGAGLARAQTPAEFYKGRQIIMYVGSDAGSGYDLYARLLARHIVKYIPGNPGLVVQNMPNAGSISMSNLLANTAPKDGTAIGAPQSSVAVERLLWLLGPGGKTANFDAAKLGWLGTMAQDVFVLLGWHGAKARTIADLKAAEFVAGVAGPNTDGSLVAAAMNKLLGTKIKLVLGYAGTTAELLAMERGEIEGAPMAYSTALTLRPNLLTDGKIDVLLQMGAKPHKDLGAVPFFADLVASPDDRAMLDLIFSKYQMGRPFFAPPGVPPDRLAALRSAFDQAMRDPDLIAEAATQKLELSPLPGADVQALVERLYASPDALVHRARQLLGTEP
jgi:tripartite-type tricarboxylate transporter receptor subunit TctC